MLNVIMLLVILYFLVISEAKMRLNRPSKIVKATINEHDTMIVSREYLGS